MTGGAPLARGGTAAGGTEDTKGGDIPTTGMEPIGTGATAVSGGIPAIPPIPNAGALEMATGCCFMTGGSAEGS